MLRDSRPATRAPVHTRLKALIVLAILTVLLAVLQRTPLALLPHRTDDFVGGLAVGFAASALIGWLMSRD